MISKFQDDFDGILGYKLPDKVFADILKSTLEPHFNGRDRNWKQEYIRSHGRLSDAAIWLYDAVSKDNCTGCLPKIIEEPSVVDIASSLKKDGFAVIPNYLSEDDVELIRMESNSFEFRNATDNEILKTSPKLNLDNNSLYYSNFTGASIKDSSPLMDLILDDFFIDISRSYFNQLQPFLTSLVYFYSPALGKNTARTNLEVKNSGQSFHFDYSHFKFLKFFIYLTDVDESSGAHTFISGSHGSNIKYPTHKKHFSISHTHPNGCIEGQIKPEYIKDNYDCADIKTHSYPKGSLIIEDTSGLHKGRQVISKDREMISLLYSISNYGAYPPENQSIVSSSSNKDLYYLSPLLDSMRDSQKKYFAYNNRVSIYDRIKRKLLVT